MMFDDIDVGGPKRVRLSDLSPEARNYLLATLDWADRDKGWDRVKHLGLEFAKTALSREPNPMPLTREDLEQTLQAL